ncbi:alpha amylase, catalytic domain-containing protein [Cryptosporidium felis]|nr:alpha amylase, catalytic domain-containing protein [Cryptosporidium felis]
MDSNVKVGGWEVVEANDLVEPVGSEKRMGAVFYKEQGVCVFRVWVVHCNRVWVVNSESKKTYLMSNDQEANIKKAVIKNVKAHDKYHFLIETSKGEKITRRDPYARFADYDSDSCYIVDFPKANSINPAPDFEFSSLIIYEIHVESYIHKISETLTDQEIREKCSAMTYFRQIADFGLETIAELGFNCLEVMPVMEYCGEWGYNPRLTMSLNQHLGSIEDFVYLIEKIHERGMFLVVDLVLHHGASRMNSLWNFDGYDYQGGIYFENGGDTGWGAKFSFEKKEVQEMLYEACRVLLGEYGVDGLRIDSAHNIPNWLLKGITGRLRREFPGKFLVAEVVPENPRYLEECGFDSCWIHSSYYDVISQFRGQKSQQEWNQGYSRSLIQGHHGFSSSGQCILTMLGNHDQIGNRCNGAHPSGDDRIGRYVVDQFGGRLSWDARAYCRMLYSLSCVSFGVPMIFMGTENLQGEWWSAKDRLHNYDWSLIKNQDSICLEMRKLVKDINALKAREKDVFSSKRANFKDFDINTSHLLVTFVRQSQEKAFLCIVNMDPSEWLENNYSVNVSGDITGTFGKVLTQKFNSQSQEYGGWDGSYTNPKGGEIYPDESSDRPNHRYNLSVPKYSVTIYEFSKTS